MFLHLGADVMIPKQDIIAILDVYTGLVDPTRDFLKMARSQGLVETIGEPEKVRTYVITTDTVYLSPISCGTLKKRTGLAHPGLIDF
ncbi:MAG: extracellular matrix regulator RemB [Bacillota bacterium]